MKKLLVGLLLLGCISSFASDIDGLISIEKAPVGEEEIFDMDLGGSYGAFFACNRQRKEYEETKDLLKERYNLTLNINRLVLPTGAYCYIIGYVPSLSNYKTRFKIQDAQWGFSEDSKEQSYEDLTNTCNLTVWRYLRDEIGEQYVTKINFVVRKEDKDYCVLRYVQSDLSELAN